MSVVLSRLALRSPRRLLKGLVSGVGLALALAIGSPLLAGIGVTLPTLGSALAVCPAATGTSFSSAYGPAYANNAVIHVTLSATTGTTGCQMAYSIFATGGLTTSWGDYHYDNYNPVVAPAGPNPPSRWPGGLNFDIHPTVQGVVHWYYNYRECASHTIPDKTYVAGVYFAVSTDNGPCSGAANTNGNWTFVDRTVIYDTVAPLSSSTSPVYSDRSVAVTYTASDPTSGIASVSVYRTQGTVPATTDALCGTLTTASGTVNCATTADGTWRFYSLATDKADNDEARPAAADDTTFVDTQPPSVPVVSAPSYSSASTGVITWTASDPAPASGIVNYEHAFIAGTLSNGSCISWGAWNYEWLGNTTTHTEGWGSNKCWQTAILAQDAAGNTSGWGGYKVIILDNQSPSTSISTSTPCVAPGGQATYTTGRTDPGPSSGWLANGSTSWLNGVEGPWDATRIDPWGADTGASATFNAGGFPTPAYGTQGVYTRVVWTRDNAQNTADWGWNQGRSQGINVTVDNTAPNGAWISGPAYTTSTTANFTFNANAGGCNGIDSVSISNNNGVWTGLGNVRSVNWDFTTGGNGANANQGAHAVRISFHEKGTGNWNESTFTFIYDTVPPVWNGFTAPVGNKDTLGAWRSAPSYNFAWNAATDATSGLSATPYPGWLESSPLVGGVCGAVDASTNLGSLSGPSYAATNLTSGRCYRVAIQAIDKAGNNAPGGGGWYFSAWVGVDLTPPTIGIPAPNMTYSNAITNAGPPGWSVSWAAATDAASGVAIVTITEYYAAASGGVCPADGSYIPEAASGNLGAGASSHGPNYRGGENYCYAYKVAATDRAGNSFTSALGPGILVDTVAPIQSGYTFSGGSNWFASGTKVYINTNVNGSVLVTALVTDAGSGVKNVRFSNPSGQAGWSYPQGVDPTYPYDDLISWNAGADIWAGTPSSQAEDNAGNVSAWSSGWTFVVDNSPPEITWTNPTADVYDTTGTVTPSWTVTDTGSGVSSAGTVTRFYLPTLSANVCSGAPVNDGVQTSGVATTVVSGRCYYWTFTTPPSDILGNETAANLTSPMIKVDTVHPTGDLIFDDLSGVTHSRFINASVTMEDANSGPLQVRFSTDGGFSWTAWTAYVVSTPVTPTVTPLTLASGTGTYTVLAQIQDLAGNMTPLGQSTALLNEVVMPLLGAAAKIYDCANPSTLLATNTTGTIYWPVDRTLCFVPTARLVTPGSDGTNNPTLVGTIAAPSGTPGNYVLHDPDQTWALVGGTWPTSFVGVTRTAADTPLRFTFGRETSSLSTSTPYLTIPYDTQAVVGWYNGATLVRSETVTVTLNLRVVIKNSGTTGTQ